MLERSGNGTIFDIHPRIFTNGSQDISSIHVCLSGVIPNNVPFTSTMKFDLIQKKDVLYQPLRNQGEGCLGTSLLSSDFDMRHSDFEAVVFSPRAKLDYTIPLCGMGFGHKLR